MPDKLLTALTLLPWPLLLPASMLLLLLSDQPRLWPVT
jgi:hypothetical protein